MAELILFTDVPADARSVAALDAAGLAYTTLRPDGGPIPTQAPDATVIVNGFTVLDAATIAALPKLSLIALTSMGTDMVDLDAARRHGVTVTNIPGDTAAVEVATHAFGLLLAVVRNIVAADRLVQAGGWTGYEPVSFPRLADQTLGVIGGGRIGRTLVDSFGVHFGRVLVYDPYLSVAPEGAALVGLDELLEQSDAISVHVPLYDQTRGLLGAVEFARMKPGAVLINVARGALIDETALLDALNGGRLAGAGVDVLVDEPPLPEHPLLHHPAVIVTPHIAYHSSYSARRYTEIPIANAIARSVGDDLQSTIVGS